MKKIVSLVFLVMAAASVFAYEPKSECISVKGNKVSYEESYDWHTVSTCTRMWSYNKKSGKFTYYRSGSFESMWTDLLSLRETYDLNLKVAETKDDTCSTCAFIEKYKSAYENNELNEAEMKQYESLVKLHGSANDLASSIEGKAAHAKTATKSYYETAARSAKEKAIEKIPFVTEENWKTITEAEWMESLQKFLSEL